jgi:hypothetical protein
MDVVFDKPEGSPFATKSLNVPQGQEKSFGTPTVLPTVPPTPYRYTMTIYDGQYRGGQIVIDPEVVVDGSPPGSDKKRAKKSAQKRAKKSARQGAGRKVARKRK